MDRQTIIRDWLKLRRGDLSQEALADAITASTGWHIGRERYSKYETGALPVGPKVLAYFVAYWGSAPDFTPSPAPAGLPDPLERIASAVEDIARTLADLRVDMAGQSGATIGAVQLLGEQLTASLAGMRVER
jgi:hypothetical protein